MKNLLLLILASCSFLAIGQDSETRISSNLEIDFFIDNYVGQSSIELSDVTGYELTTERLSFSSNISITKGISENLAWNFGLGLSSKKFTGRFYCHICDLTFIAPVEVDLYYVRAPLMLRFNKSISKFGLYGDVGLVSNVLIKKDFDEVSFDPFTEKFYVSGAIKFGASFELNKKMSLLFSTSVEKSITNHIQEAGLNNQSLGFGTALQFKL